MMLELPPFKPVVPERSVQLAVGVAALAIEAAAKSFFCVYDIAAAVARTAGHALSELQRH